jgi:GNAT superfamily N-acetyltransferase
VRDTLDQPKGGQSPFRVRRALLETALDELRSHAHQARLWIFKENHAGRAFYAQFGFTPDGVKGVDPGTGLDEIRLRAEL